VTVTNIPFQNQFAASSVGTVDHHSRTT